MHVMQHFGIKSAWMWLLCACMYMLLDWVTRGLALLMINM